MSMIMKRLFLFSIIAGCIGTFFSGCARKKTAQSTEQQKSSGILQPEWSRNAVIYEINWRQMTDAGNIAGVKSQLGRLKELGADILWLMPINPISEDGRKGSLGSYYAVKDYTALNPELGTIDEFKDFVDTAHNLGMKIIIDWVPNHTGRDNKWVNDHPDWFMRNEQGEMFGPYDWTDVYKLNYSVAGMRNAMIDAMIYWIKETGIDGFRCDVAGEVPIDFWEEARPQLDAAKENGEIFMLAEASMPALHKKAFNMGYNWPMKDVFNAIAQTQGLNTHHPADGSTERDYGTATPSSIDSLLASQATEYPADSYLMNMITNHDLNSWEGTEFERLGRLNKAFAILSWTLPGMPLIYTGQETGMDRAFEFFEKDTPPQWEPRNEYFRFYQKLNHLKHTQRALRAGENGDNITRYATTDNNLYAFSRKADESEIFVLLNLGAQAADVDFTGSRPDIKQGEWIDFFNATESIIPTRIESGDYLILIKRP